MNKKYLMKGMAALALLAGFSSCVKDVDGVSPEDSAKKAKENAELQLGFVIPDGQTWDMASQVEAKVTVNLAAGETYEVAIYANDPVADGVGRVLAKGSIQSGKAYTTQFTAPKEKSAVWIGVTDKNNYTRYKQAVVKNDQLVADFGVSSAEARSMRAVTINGDTYDEFNFPSREEITAAFPTAIPNDADGPDNLNNYNVLVQNGANHNYKITTAGTYTIGGGWQNITYVSDPTHPYGGYNAVQPINLYVSVGANETVTISRNGNINFNLYILSGKVTLDSNFGEMGGCIISIAPGTVLYDNRTSLSSNYGIKVYNRGTLYASNSKGYDIGNNASLYNEGTFTSTGPLSYSAGAGNTSYFINFGDDAELSAPSMTMNSTCHFFTDGNVNITGLTSVTQSGIVWINNGHYTTGSLKFSAGNGTFYNYCQLVVTGNTWFMDGQFNLMPNSYTEMNTGIFNNFHVNMYDNSGINITGGSKWGRQGAGIYQGFRAINDNAKAYVRIAGHSQVPHHKGGAIHFNGKKLTYAIENITFYENFANIDLSKAFSEVTYSDPKTAEDLATAKSENITFDPADTGERVEFDEMAFTEPAEGECSATWGEDGKEKDEEPAPVTFAFEDQISNGDYDLNDVVLKVTPHVVKSGKKITSIDYDNLDIKLVAAGATFDITVMVDKTALSFNGKTEVHDAFGVNKGVMVNTGGTAKSGYQQNATPVICTIATPEDVKTNETDSEGNPILNLSKLNIWIDVNPGKASAAQIFYLKEKEEPYAVMIPMDWAWPKERVCIKDAYVGSKDATDINLDPAVTTTYKENSFAVWASTLNRNDTMNGWYNHPLSAKTMKNN